MALIKKMTENGVDFEYHTPIIIQNGQKKTTISVSSWVDADSYKSGNKAFKSRWYKVALDSKYPTSEEIYKKLTESRKDENSKELNPLADAVSDEAVKEEVEVSK